MVCSLRRLVCTGSLALLILTGGAAESAASAITPFSAGLPGSAFPPPWRSVTLPNAKRPTQYTLVADEGMVVLRAQANASMASVVHPLKVDPKNFPVITWRWKISNLLSKANIKTKAGDDFPARVYVWSPYTDRVRVKVVESGATNVGRWREVKRDLVADFREAFGEDPPAISGVAVASDTDNTGESVSAWFGDLRLSAQSQKAR